MRTHRHAQRSDVLIDPADLAAAVAEQREELARFVRDLSDQYDIPARAHEIQETAHEIMDATEERAQELKGVAQEGAHELKERATTSDGRPRPAVLAAAVTAVAAVGVVAYVARKRNQKRKETR